jgi:glycosyltransferase involved in cell wall biosynthesis
MSLTSSISVIFPAYNEQTNILSTVETARRILPRVAKQWEIIVVNDGSHDDTGKICDDLAARYPEVSVVSHPTNRGYGAALKSGILAARHALVFFSDSDGQFDLSEIDRLLAWIDQHDMVIGYRAKRQDPIHRLVNAWGWKMLVRLLLRVRVRDIDCAFKLFRREVFERIQVRAVGAMVNTEILAQAAGFGMRMKEVPVSHFPRQHGQPTGANLRVVLRAFRELFKLWAKLRRLSHDQPGLYATTKLRHIPPQ